MIYNKDIFAQYGVAVPTTWDEFLQACETFKANGVTPIYGTFKDGWTSTRAPSTTPRAG